MISWAVSFAPPLLTADLVEFMQSGVSLLIGTRDAALRPACARPFGVEVNAVSAVVATFLPVAGSEQTVANLRDNGHIALTLSRGVDHRSLQVKGTCISIAETNLRERALQDQYFAAFAEGLRFVGHRPELLRRVRYTPSLAVRFRLESLYEQTPGPGAGRAMSGGHP